ncbi:Ras- protein Rab-14, partial [Coemansia guatemalensis]
NKHTDALQLVGLHAIHAAIAALAATIRYLSLITIAHVSLTQTFVERFRSVTRSYYRGSIGTILVYDITNRESFEDLDKWIVDAQQLTPTHSIFVLVGNKADREQLREVHYEEGEAYAKKHGMVFLEASAKTGEKVDTIFYDLVSKILKMVNDGTVDPSLPDSGVQCMKPQHARTNTSSTSGTQPVNVGNRNTARFSIGGTSCC